MTDLPARNAKLATLLDSLVRLDVAQTTPLQALLKLADVQQTARRVIDGG